MNPGRWSLALWYAVVAAYWFEATHAVLGRALGEQLSSAALVGATLFGLAGRFGSQCVEALYYAAAGRVFGTRVRALPMLGSIATLSLADAIAENLVRMAQPAGASDGFAGVEGAPVWLAVVAGFRVVPHFFAGEPGVRLAFGSFGLLALVRVLGTAFAQGRQGVPMGRALVLTGSAVVATRLVTWWTTDLVRGMSPLP